jgi:hypothetical protein
MASLFAFLFVLADDITKRLGMLVIGNYGFWIIGFAVPCPISKH